MPLSLVLALLLLSGCRSCDLVEAELRTRERELRELREEFHHTEAYNEALTREIQALRQANGPAVAPEQAAQIYPLKQIVLGRQTGGYDDDRRPGDEALQVVFEPQDADGHALKAPGTLHVEALEIGPGGVKTPLCSWDVPADQLRRNWRSGLFSTGYTVVLPWKRWPTADKVRVVARFTLADGRTFEADRDVTVRPVPAALREGTDPVPGEFNLNPPEILHMPRPVQESSRRLPGKKPASVQAAGLWQASPLGQDDRDVELLPPVKVPAVPVAALPRP